MRKSLMQSIQSVQHVDLFFWGQNRFASAISLPASPICGPEANLFVVLFLNSPCFYGLLLLVSYLGYPGAGRQSVMDRHPGGVPGDGRRVERRIVGPEPCSSSRWRRSRSLCHSWRPWAAFLLWKRRAWWSYGTAGALIGLALGVDPSVVLLVHC
jgi:hypothetical protein